MKSKEITRETVLNLGTAERKFPAFCAGDTIIVSQRIIEGDKERIQEFEGDVIAFRNNGISSMFTVRKIGAHGIAVERIFPYYSPLIKTIKVVRKGDVRRAKLYYVRGRVGKSARLDEKIVTKNNESIPFAGLDEAGSKAEKELV
ncbi:MAG TPA: 50S ribosomal protein L19 [Candidatus Bathyarchaeia archaeon]|nr:50S ribosomal protein L19 [Candidatus Bathyarchaeia archaeon]